MNNLNVIITPELGTISTNFEELKAAIREEVAGLDTAQFTEDSKTAARGTVADLRKMKKAIDDRRKEVKKAFMEPFKTFEGQCGELQEIIDKPIIHITAQIDQYEAKRRQERQKAIDDAYKELIGDCKEYLPLDRIQTDKWMNVATTIKSIRGEITAAITKVTNDLAVINMSQSEAKETALNVYRRSLELSEAIQHINKYEAQKAEILKREEAKRLADEERQRELEIQRIRSEERKRIAEEERIKQEARQEVAAEIQAPISDEIVKNVKVTAVYTVSASDEELSEIETFFDSIGVAFSRKSL